MICGELLWTTTTPVCWHTGQSLFMKDLRVDNGASCDSPACGHRGVHEAPVYGLRAASCGLRDEVNGGMRLQCSGIFRALAPAPLVPAISRGELRGRRGVISLGLLSPRKASAQWRSRELYARGRAGRCCAVLGKRCWPGGTSRLDGPLPQRG